MYGHAGCRQDACCLVGTQQMILTTYDAHLTEMLHRVGTTMLRFEHAVLFWRFQPGNRPGRISRVTTSAPRTDTSTLPRS